MSRDLDDAESVAAEPDAVDLAVRGLGPISLADVESSALPTRIDRKYVVDIAAVDELIDAHRERLVVLEIDGRRTFRYSSLYFDTVDAGLHRAAATGRRRRVKVRTRSYDDAGIAMLELKTKDGRGRTVKHRRPHEPTKLLELGVDGRAFVDEMAGIGALADTLVPALTTHYRRVTVVDRVDGHRSTLDVGLVCRHVDGRSLGFDKVIVETKSAGAPGEIDRWMWRRGHRPERISKYCTMLALLDPSLPRNKWHRTITRHFDGA